MKELILLFGFMTLPVWIPVIGTTVGMTVDVLKGRRKHAAVVPALDELKARRAAEQGHQSTPALVESRAA